MSKATYPLKLPLSIKKAAQRLAKEDGVSLNQWIAAAVAEKVGVVETAADFFRKRAGKATGEELMKFLRTAPKLAPEPCMPAIVVRNISVKTHRALRVRARQHGRSTEAEIRAILDGVVRPRLKLVSALAALVKPFGGLELKIKRDKKPANLA